MPDVDDELRSDLIVIGSGFGGAVCALRAAEAGLRVVVLERGRSMHDDTYADLANGRIPAFHGAKQPGLIEFYRTSGLVAFDGNAIGGTSHLYTAVTLPAPAEVFAEGWPAGIDRQTLDPWYARVQAMIAPCEMPGTLPRVDLLETIARQVDGRLTRLPLSMTWPAQPKVMSEQPSPNGVYHELATWLRGGRAARKRTIADTYLHAAEARGATILPLHEAQRIEARNAGYAVSCRRWTGTSWTPCEFTAPRVVVAAGTIGTLKLLLNCRDVFATLPNLSAKLGEQFSTNGDFGALLIDPKERLPLDSGPPVTSWIDLWERDRMFVMETGVIPYDTGSLAGILSPAKWLSGMRLSPAKRCVWSLGVMGDDDAPGTLRLSRRGKMIHRFDARRGRSYRRRVMENLRRIAEAAGAKLLAPPEIVIKRLPITVHPLGGAIMADSPDVGVVDAYGEAFGHAGLFVADGSVIPTATGVPPSMTIAAMAERIAEHLVQTC